jgi:hypothetical protein
MESDGGFPMLEILDLKSLDSLKSIVWNAKAMLQLQILSIEDCPVLKTIKIKMEELPNLKEIKIKQCRVLKTFRVEELPNLREIYISYCAELKELSMESGGGLPRLERLHLRGLNSFREYSVECKNNVATPILEHRRLSRVEHKLLPLVDDIQNCGGATQFKGIKYIRLPPVKDIQNGGATQFKGIKYIRLC